MLVTRVGPWVFPWVCLAFACGSPAPTHDDLGADAGPDLGPPAPIECTAPPAPAIGGTAATDALADAAAACGQASFAWLREGVGEPVSLGDRVGYRASILESLAGGLGLTLPREPEYDARLQIFTYRTQDRGTLLDATALVAFPEDLEPGTETEVVLYLHGSSGFNDECAATAGLETQVIAALLASYGYVAVAPDYLGLKNGGEPTGFLNPALVGQPTAIASLDALRAAMRLMPEDRGNTCLPSRYLTVGGSQGGHAALWVDRLAPYYARELTPLGTVATVPPADLLGELEVATTTLSLSSGSASIFLATGGAWYGHGDRLDEVFVSPQDERIPQRLAESCSRRITAELTSIDELFTPAIQDAAAAGTLAELDPWGCMAAENGVLTTSVPALESPSESYGVLMVVASEDELVSAPVERAAFAALCEAGMPIRYLECEGATHIDGTLWSLGEILEFADERVRGEPWTQPSCEVPAAIRCSGTPD